MVKIGMEKANTLPKWGEEGNQGKEKNNQGKLSSTKTKEVPSLFGGSLTGEPVNKV